MNVSLCAPLYLELTLFLCFRAAFSVSVWSAKPSVPLSMGAYNNDGVLSPIYSLGSSHDVRISKHVHDNVHGNIYLDPVLFSIFSFDAPIVLSSASLEYIFCFWDSKL